MGDRGLFITVEGGEGVGKSTNIDCLRGFLDDNGIEAVITREPGGTRLGEDIRETLLKVRREPVAAMAEVLLVFAARAQHISEVIEPALASGKWVLCDRFTDATYAYQCGGRGLDGDVVRRLETLVQGPLRPDYTVLLDAPVAVGLERARGRGELDRFEREDLDFFERVRARYLDRAREDASRFRVIDATAVLPRIQHQVRECGGEFLARWRDRGGAA
jgi:dTMP kinase